MTALVFWAHPQTHILAEHSAREIAKKKVKELEPSNRFVVALHHGLLYGKHSPFAKDHILSTNIDRDSGIYSATKIKINYVLDPNKMKFRYYKFLMEAKQSIHKHLETFQIDIDADLLFNNIVAHSVDHHLLYQSLKKISVWSMDGGTSLPSYWRSQVFLSMWIHHVATPMEEEKIGKLPAKKYPFYHALYNDLAKADLELANCILASTSF